MALAEGLAVVLQILPHGLLGQPFGIEFPNHLFAGDVEELFDPLVDEDEAAVLVLDGDNAGIVFHEELEKFLLLVQLPFLLGKLVHGIRESGGVQFVLGKLRQGFEALQLAGRDLTRLGIDGANAADPVAAGAMKREPGVEPDVWFPGDKRIIHKPGIGRGIRHDQGVVGQNGVGTESGIARAFAFLDTETGFEPLPVLIHEGEDGDGHIQNDANQLRNAIEPLLAHRSQLELAEGFQTVCLNDRKGRRRHACMRKQEPCLTSRS